MLRLLGVNLGHVEAMLGHLGLKMRYAMASYAYDGPFWGHVGLRPRPAKKNIKHGVAPKFKILKLIRWLRNMLKEIKDSKRGSKAS